MRSICQRVKTSPMPFGITSNTATNNINGITSAKPVIVGRSNACPTPIKSGSEPARTNPMNIDARITPGIDPIVPRTIIANAGNSRAIPTSGFIGNTPASRAPPKPEIPDERKALVR